MDVSRHCLCLGEGPEMIGYVSEERGDEIQR